MATAASMDFERPIVELEKQIDELKKLAGDRQLSVTAEIAPLERKLADLRAAAATEANLMPALIECAEAYATLGEMCGVFRAVFGEYREPVLV